MRVISVKAEEKRRDVLPEVAPGLALRCDRRALTQLMLNLLANTVPFTKPGGRDALRARESHGYAMVTRS
jgi:signal transduction histidine kinase